MPDASYLVPIPRWKHRFCRAAGPRRICKDESPPPRTSRTKQPRNSSRPRGCSETPATPASKGATDEPPPQEMVPEVSLNEYVSGFRYVPVSQAEEIAIRGEHPVPGREAPAPEDGPASTSAETVSAEAIPVTPAEDVIERLGLEPMEDRSDRPRFLDINHASPPPPAEGPAERASSISTPSFLGLSDTLPIAPEGKAEPVEEPQRAKWRVWFAVAVVLVLAALGILQWRSQVRHANNGPVEIVEDDDPRPSSGRIVQPERQDYWARRRRKDRDTGPTAT